MVSLLMDCYSGEVDDPRDALLLLDQLLLLAEILCLPISVPCSLLIAPTTPFRLFDASRGGAVFDAIRFWRKCLAAAKSQSPKQF